MSDSGSSNVSGTSRKESTHHRSAQMTVHFHTDGEICPSSFGQVCPLGDVYDQPEPGQLPPGIIPRMPNGSGFYGGGFGGGGFGAGFGGGFGGMGFNPAMLMGMGGGGGGMDMGDGGDMNAMMATMLSAMSADGGAGFGMPGIDSMDPFGGGFDMSSLAGGLPSSFDGTSSPYTQGMGSSAFGNPAMAMAMAAAQGGGGAFGGGNPAMAMMAAMAAAQGGGGGDPSSNPAMAMMKAMAAAQGGGAGGAASNPAMAMMAAMAAAQSGGPGGQPLPPQIVAAKMKAAVAQAQTNMQIAQTVGNSSLAKLTDDQTRTFSNGKFITTKEFVNFMQSANTEVGNFKDFHLTKSTLLSICIQILC